MLYFHNMRSQWNTNLIEYELLVLVLWQCTVTVQFTPTDFKKKTSPMNYFLVHFYKMVVGVVKCHS